ncbi:AAA family ATPase [Pseudaminobacter sp. 19-2017]|uniref:AAA family ATPase n=1 Tax=Pseudaminobacter soli (ex Zhang et al. 2022) TaxID=2831468 RepID=A0A942I4C2_9HYPH|nr:AAA family ATPase [Pseudaminobacter soli]MBS3651693.1 AAA family ATPase [Pseudaminobacter soli]
MTLQKLLDPLTDAEARVQTNVRFVEFFGLPGIGKTTVANLLGNKLQQCNLAVDEDRSAYEKRTFVGRQLYRFGIISSRLADREFRRLSVRIARFVAEGGQATAIDLVREIWHLCYLSAYILDKRSSSASILVLDQGLLQGFWSVFLKSRRRRTSENWLDILSSIGVDDVVFLHLRGDIVTAQGRLLKRGDQSSRMQKASPDGDLEVWVAADRACREMAADLKTGTRAANRAGVLAAVDVGPLASPDEVAERALRGLLLACRDRLPPVGG